VRGITHRWLPMSLALLASVQAGATEFESVEAIRAVAAQHARQRLPHADHVEVVSVDERLRLKRCGKPLQAHAKPTNNRAGLTVEVRCPGPHPWKLYVPVRVSTTEPVVVAIRGLAANQVLSLQDVRLEPRATSSLPYGFFTDPSEVLGARMRRTIASGTVLVPAALTADKLVRRGQRVTLIRSTGGIMVKGSGIALTDGVKTQRIRVKTPSSRVVEGTVISADIVQIGS
jgi:flagella basal body P-ring formation protein FlgA